MVHLGPLVQDDPSSSNLLPPTSTSKSSSTTNGTTQQMIPLEDPSTIPPDETTFTTAPHFTPTNPFHRSLSSLDLSFRCTICFELYNVPVSLYPCLHTFCSMCIRKNLRTQFCGMKRKAECPVCNTNLLTNGSGGNWEKAILPNRDLESKVDLYREGVRGELRRSLVRLDVLERRERMRNSEQNGGNDGNNDEQKQPAAAAGISMSSLKRARRSTANYKREYSSDHDNDDGNDVDETMTSSDSNDGGRTAVASAVDASSIPPPPASAAASINNHNIQQPQRKRKPTISYHNLKRKQLLTLCTTENLPTTGTDQELKHRHSEYILLYNSQCDSQHPMSEREVVATVMKEEKGRKREAVKKTTGSKKKVDGEMERKFKEMIESVKARKNGGGVSDSSIDCKDGDGGVVPSCIAAAAAAVVNGSIGSNHNASKPRAKSGNDVSVAAASTTNAVAGGGAPSMKAAAASSTSSSTTTTTQRKSITNNIHKQKATPSKSRTSKKQATLSSAAKKKSCGIWKCPTCTFENHKYTTATALCEMCGTPRPEKENTSNEVISIDC